MSRTITTAAELDALPAGSVVLDRWGCARQKGRDADVERIRYDGDDDD